MFDEARAFISNVEPSSLTSWYAWKEDWPDWRLVTEIEGLTEPIFRTMHVSPPPPPKGTQEESLKIENEIVRDFAPRAMRKNDGGDVIDFTSGEFILRAKKRFNRRLIVTVVGEKNQIFTTHSKDISVGGIYLEDSLPAWVSGYFKVRIGKPNTKQQVELTCCLIENQSVNHRYRIAILPLESLQDEKNLEAWLAA